MTATIEQDEAQVLERMLLLIENAGDALAARPDALRAAKAWVADHVIEVFERPSRTPGEEPKIHVDEQGRRRVVWDKGSFPKQIAFQQKFFDRIGNEDISPTVYALAGSNRCAKSVTCWGLCFCKHIRDYAKDGEIYWCIGTKFDKLKQGPHKWLWDYLPHAMFERDYSPGVGFGDRPSLVLDLAKVGRKGKCTVVFHSQDQDLTEFESDPVTGMVWTEATRDALLESLLLRLTDTNGFLLIDYLPVEGWHREKLMEAPHVHHETFGMVDNQHNLPPGAIRKKIADLAGNEEAIALRIYGQPRAAMGVVYKQFKLDRHVIEPFDVPSYWPLYLAGDWGYRRPHAFALCAVAPTGVLYVIDEQYAVELTVSQVAMELWRMLGRYRNMPHHGFMTAEQMFEECAAINNRAGQARWDEDLQQMVGASNPVRDQIAESFAAALKEGHVVVDDQIFQEHGDGPNRTLAQQFADMGVPVAPAMKRNIDWGVEEVRRLFYHDRLFFFDRCRYLRRDHASWKYRVDKDGRPVPGKDRYDETNKHGADAVRYLVMSFPSHAEPYIGAA